MRIKILLIFFSATLFLPNLFDKHLVTLINKRSSFDVAFDTSYVKKIQSLNDLEKIIDEQQSTQSINKNSLAYAELMHSLVLKRFHFGYSYYSLRENWIAVVAGRFLWDDLAAIVIPDDILKYPMGACSQQSIVLMAIFQRKGIPCRKVVFDHHFAMEARINDQWYYFDPTLNPVFPNDIRTSIAAVLKGHLLKQLYLNSVHESLIDTTFANPVYGKINQEPAPRARLFHIVTRVLSHWLWLLPLFVYILLSFPNPLKWPSRYSISPTME